MNVIETSGVTHRYGRVTALCDVDLTVSEGAVYALLGPNGAGKTTLLQILMGLRRATSGHVSMLGKTAGLAPADRAEIGYVAEGQRLPRWMRLRQLEAYLAPLYPGWDAALADELRERFRLDANRRIGALSRGAHEGRATLRARAASALARDGRTVHRNGRRREGRVGPRIARDVRSRRMVDTHLSHDIAEIEPLADWIGFLDGGRLEVSQPADALRDEFLAIEVDAAPGATIEASPPPGAFCVERAGARLVRASRRERCWRSDRAGVVPGASRIEIRNASLREIFVALASGPDKTSMMAEAQL